MLGYVPVRGPEPERQEPESPERTHESEWAKLNENAGDRQWVPGAMMQPLRLCQTRPCTQAAGECEHCRGP